MFDSIDLSSIDDMDSLDSMGTDDGFTSGSEFLHTVDFSGIDETSLGTEILAEIEISSPLHSVITHDSAPWDSDETLPGNDFNPNESHEVSPKTIDTSELENEISFKGSGYSQSEINSHISEAKQDIAYAKSQIRSHTELLKDSNYPETEKMHIQNAERDLKAAQAELSKWQSTKPSK